MLDPEPQVQASTALTIAQAGLKAATPALIQGLRSTDPGVQNASRTALQRLWSSSSANTPDEWDSYWRGQAQSVPEPIDPATLAPLVTPEELEQASSGHDE
jgi:HEAT repeat protein